MERVREPSELILDENDDHLIFEIPNDPNDCQARQQRSARESREKADANTSISPTKASKVPQKVCSEEAVFIFISISWFF